MKPVGIVQHQSSVPPGHILSALQRANVDHVVIDAPQIETWPTATDLSGLIVLGGTMNVDELDRYPFLQQSRALMSQALEEEIPTVGVCLGAQMMARVLGAEVRRAPTRNAFFSPLELTEDGVADPVLAPFAEGIPVLQFHEDTFSFPSDAVPLATSAGSGLAQAFRYGHHAYAIQFHFEADGAIVKRWVEDIGPTGMVEQWNCADEGRALQDETALSRQAQGGLTIVESFIELARHAPAS